MSDQPEGGILIRADFGQRAAIKERTDLLMPCRHEQTVVDEVERTVECGTCGATLDAFSVLLQYARKERHWRHWQREVARCHNELAKLKEEERKVKARTRSASRKDAAEAVRAERERTEESRRRIIAVADDLSRCVRRLHHWARSTEGENEHG